MKKNKKDTCKGLTVGGLSFLAFKFKENSTKNALPKFKAIGDFP